jgi:hypothetical protein
MLVISQNQEELDRASHALLGITSNLKVGNWEADSAGSSSALPPPFLKGKAKVANLD